MSVHITGATYFSRGVRELAQASQVKAEAFRNNVIATLMRGGETKENAEAIASCCDSSRTSHHFELATDRKTITVKMTNEEFALVQAILGMEETSIM
jgi:hypothetical protein